MGNKLLKNSRNVKPDTIRTAFLFGLELEMEGKSEDAKDKIEKADKSRNIYRFEADVLLTWLREWDRRTKVPENYLEGMPEAMEPVDSPAYQWFVDSVTAGRGD